MILLKPIVSAGFGALVYAGAGCLAPTVLQNDGEVVVLKYGTWETAHELEGRAAALCDLHGKVARLAADEAVARDPLFRTATFDCLPPQSTAS